MVWLSNAYSSQTGWNHLEGLVNLGGRRSVTESERKALELTRDALDDAGARNARIDKFEVQGWERGSSTISHTESGNEFNSFALPRSPPGTVEGRFVNIGHGAPEEYESADLDGAVVMAASSQPPDTDRNIHRREKYRMAMENGAAAFVFRNHMDGCLPRSGTIGGLNGGIGDIPAVGISKEAGLQLDRQFGGDQITVEVDATVGDATSGNVRAELGPDTTERIIVSCHVDGHDVSQSAHDNAVGTATVVEIASALSDREDELDTRVEFVGFGAEELGLIGSAQFVEQEDIGTVKAVVQNDGVSRARDLRIHTNSFESLTAPAETVSTRFDQPIIIDPKIRLSSDHWRFVERGVPSYHLASESSGPEQAFGSSNGVILTPADTFDKLDVRDLRTHSILETELVVELANDDLSLPKVEPDEIAERVEREGKTYKANIYAQEGPL
jgi:Zn-dependent M28 family amino/carboxypeptidase